MTKYTTPHSLPLIEPATDMIRSASGDNLWKQMNALAAATGNALSIEGARAEGGARAHTESQVAPVAAQGAAQGRKLVEHAARLANLDNAAGFPGDPLELNDAAVAGALTFGSATRGAMGDLIAAGSTAASISAFVQGAQLAVYGHSYTPVPGYYVPGYTGEWSSKIATWTGMNRTSYGVSSTRMIENVTAAIGTQMPGATGNRSYPAGSRGVVVLQSQMNDALMGPHSAAGRAGFKHALRAFLATVTAARRIEATTATAGGAFNGNLNTVRASSGSVRFAQGLVTDAPYLEFSGVSSPTGKIYILTLANDASSPTGTITVQVNGVDQGISYTGQGQMESFTSVVTGGGTYDYSPAVIAVTVPASGEHTIRITRAAGGSSATAYVDALLIPSVNPPIVLVCKDPAIGTFTSKPNQDAWVANSSPLATLMHEATNEFPSARIVDLAPGWDPATMAALTTDGAKFHPNETGMEHIAEKVMEGIRQEIAKRISPSIGIRA